VDERIMPKEDVDQCSEMGRSKQSALQLAVLARPVPAQATNLPACRANFLVWKG